MEGIKLNLGVHALLCLTLSCYIFLHLFFYDDVIRVEYLKPFNLSRVIKVR